MVDPLPAYEGTDPYTFVSYSHDDREDVHGEIRWLQDQGFKLWYDAGISGGSEWSESIAQAIKGASRFVFFITPRSVNSENCRRELNFALEEQISILAVHLEETEVPDGLRLNLNNRQALFRHNDASYRANITSALGRPSLPATTAPAVQARWSNRRRLVLSTCVIAIAAMATWLAWQGWDPAQTVAPTTSIAVLPFEDMSPGGDQQWLGDSTAEELIDMLARIEDLRVISRTSAFSLRGSDIKTIGRELDVGSVIEGSVRRSGDQIRVSAQLVRVQDGAQLWSARYDEKLEDIFAIQAKISRALAAAIHDELGVSSNSGFYRSRYQTADVRAYELVAKAVAKHEQFTEKGIREGLVLNDQALAIDPDYAQAHAEFGWGYFLLASGGYDQSDKIWANAKAGAERALELEPTLGAAHNLLASLLMHEGDWKAAEARWQRGLALAPGHGATHLVYGLNLLYKGRIEDARVHILRALDLDPKDPKTRKAAGALYLKEGNYPAAIEQYEQVPDDDEAAFQLSYAHHMAGNDTTAAALMLEFEPSFVLRLAGWFVFALDGYTGLLQAGLEGVVQESGKSCTDLPETAAMLLAIIGEADRMLGCLGEVTTSKSFLGSDGFTAHPGFDPYRDDPRFIAAVNRLRSET